MARIAHYRDALSAYTAACALDQSGHERWLVVTIGMGWKYVYATCAQRSLPAITDLARVSPEHFDAFSRTRVKRSSYWTARKADEFANAAHYRCLVCGVGPVAHAEIKPVLT